MFAPRRLMALLTLTALTATACTERADVMPTTSIGTSTTAPSPTTDTTSPSTTLPPDTAVTDTTTVPATAPDTAPPETAAPETTVAPTTTAAATGDPTSVSTEYFLGGEPDAWLFLGRWTGNAWEADRADDGPLREPAAADGDDVLIHTLDIAPIEGSLDGSGEACADDGRTGPIILASGDAPDDSGVGFHSIAFPADWSTWPRPVALVDASVERYVEAGAAAFDDLGIDTSSGRIEQLLVSDLDGDGDTEALVAFDGDAFSALLMIDADTGTALTIARSVATTVTPTTVAGADEPGEPTTTPNDTYRVLAVADLNGNGRFEIVAQASEGTRADVTVSTYDGTEVDPVLAAGC